MVGSPNYPIHKGKLMLVPLLQWHHANRFLISVVAMTLCPCSWMVAGSPVMFGMAAVEGSVSPLRQQYSTVNIHLPFGFHTGPTGELEAE